MRLLVNVCISAQKRALCGLQVRRKDGTQLVDVRIPKNVKAIVILNLQAINSAQPLLWAHDSACAWANRRAAVANIAMACRGHSCKFWLLTTVAYTQHAN